MKAIFCFHILNMGQKKTILVRYQNFPKQTNIKFQKKKFLTQNEITTINLAPASGFTYKVSSVCRAPIQKQFRIKEKGTEHTYCYF